MPPTNKAKVASKERGKSLAEKASFATHGYALDDDNSNDPMTMTFANGAGNNHTYSRKRKLSQGRNKKKSLDSNGIKSSNIKSTSSSTRDTSGVPRIFRNLTNHSDSHRPLASDTTAAAGPAVASSIATPCFIRNDPSYSDNRTSLQRTPAADPRNPYTRDRFCPPSSAKTRYDSNRSVATSPRSSVHVVTSISENLARETCLATMDAGSPVSIQVHKMGNGLMYSETIAFLEMMQPDEILLNEGRKNSQLCQKVLQLFGSVAQSANDDHDGLDNSINTRDLTGACRTNTVVKFVPRSYFDQNRGAELLRHVAREGAYDATVLEEYILLSSSYALLQYMQICLGADFARSSLDLCMNWGGSYKMAIDRGTISHLELLSNAKTGKANNSLIGTIDCTKTSVGSRLLRMNIMAPPSREDTILARLDLVDTFLEDEQFFYEVMDQLCALPDLEKMLGPIALVPKKRFGGGNKRQVTARMASAGISSLVCIKSALSVVPNFARVLEIQLNSLIARDDDRARGNFTSDVSKSSSGSGDDSSHCSVSSSSVSDKSMHDDDNTSNPFQSDKSKGNNDNFSQALVSTLQLGLGSGPISPTRYGASGSERGHQLLRAILSAMKNPHLQEILDAVVDIFTESTTYSKNSHAMRHQECFALKPNTDGMMVSYLYTLINQYHFHHFQLKMMCLFTGCLEKSFSCQCG
jgi:DNA mismatch repair protein MSH4